MKEITFSSLAVGRSVSCVFLFPPSHSNTSGEKKSFSKPAVKFWAFEDYSMPVKYFYLRFCIKMEKKMAQVLFTLLRRCVCGNAVCAVILSSHCLYPCMGKFASCLLRPILDSACFTKADSLGMVLILCLLPSAAFSGQSHCFS